MKPFVKGLIIGGMLVAVVFLLLLNSSVPLLFNATFSPLRSGNVPQDSVKITQEYLYARLQEISPALENYLETTRAATTPLAGHENALFLSMQNYKLMST